MLQVPFILLPSILLIRIRNIMFFHAWSVYPVLQNKLYSSKKEEFIVFSNYTIPSVETIYVFLFSKTLTYLLIDISCRSRKSFLKWVNPKCMFLECNGKEHKTIKMWYVRFSLSAIKGGRQHRFINTLNI